MTSPLRIARWSFAAAIPTTILAALIGAAIS